MVSKLILWLNAAVYIGWGLLSIYSPEIQARASGFILTNGDAHIEIAAVYGGFGIGVGVFILLGAIRAEYQSASLLLAVLGAGGLVLGRLISLPLTDDLVTGYTYSTLAVESTMAISALLVLLRGRS